MLLVVLVVLSLQVTTLVLRFPQIIYGMDVLITIWKFGIYVTYLRVCGMEDMKLWFLKKYILDLGCVLCQRITFYGDHG